MPRILKLTIIHMLLAMTSGYFIGLGVLGAGFGSQTEKATYGYVVNLWQALDAPAGLYVFHAQNVDWNLFLLLQVGTSFVWANLIAFALLGLKAYRHNN